MSRENTGEHIRSLGFDVKTQAVKELEFYREGTRKE